MLLVCNNDFIAKFDFIQRIAESRWLCRQKINELVFTKQPYSVEGTSDIENTEIEINNDDEKIDLAEIETDEPDEVPD